jgi:hypothetical protein
MCNVAALIALDGANKVPCATNAFQFWDFRKSILYLVFAEVHLPEGRHFAHCLRGMSLADGHQAGTAFGAAKTRFGGP